MTVRKRALKTFRNLNLPVSYHILDEKHLSDARNIFENKGVTDTRFGLARYNSISLGGPILSVSYFRKSDGTSYKLAKVGTNLYSVSSSGASTVIKSGLSASTKHKAVTLTDRHIVTIESDGLFSFDGTIFTQLGQLPPSGASISEGASGGSLVDGNSYNVGLTFSSSATGFETNIGLIGNKTIEAPALQINVTSIPTIAANGTIDKVNIYLQNTTTGSAYRLVTQLDLGVTSYTITGPTLSTISPPIKNAPPISGGGTYIKLFGKRVVYSGNSTFKSDVFFSEEYLPDAFDSNLLTQTVLQTPGQGPVTGLGIGLYSDTHLDPFLLMFKKNSTHVYSELNNSPSQTTVDERIGCISGDTVRTRNGGVAFMSDNGWRYVVNGRIETDAQGTAITLGNGAIDSVFSRVGWQNELNLPQAASFFSTYYTIHDHYLTFICEGSSTSITKAYVYEEKIGGFRVFEFKYALVSGCEGEDDNSYQTIYLGDSTGTLFTYSYRNSKHDEDNAGNSLTIPAYALLPYVIPGEDSCTYNFRTLAVRALVNSNPITIKTYPSFSTQIYNSFLYDFSNTTSGFTLDVSRLDVDSFGDEQLVVTAMADLNQAGETILIGFFQDVLDSSIGLLSAQLTSNKNSNRNH